MNKIPCASQNTEVKTLSTDVCVFGCFGRLLPAAVHSADCWLDSGVKWCIHVSSIVTYLRKISFLLHWNSFKQYSESSTCWCFWSTVNKCDTDFEHSFPIDNVHAKWWIYLSSDIFNSSTISRNFNLRSPKRSLWRFFFSVFRDNCRIWATWAFSINCICTTAFNHCLFRSLGNQRL